LDIEAIVESGEKSEESSNEEIPNEINNSKINR